MKKLLLLVALLLPSFILAQQNEPEVVNIMHPLLQAFMNDRTYENGPRDTSIIAGFYRPDELDQRLDHPQGINITWEQGEPESELTELRIFLAEERDFCDAIVHHPSSLSSTSLTIRNLFPNRTYYYLVEEVCKDGTCNILKHGTFRTVGQVRMVQIEGVRNVRDIGGWPTQFGKHTRYGLMYRSGHLQRVTENGRHCFVDDMNVRAELDLRSESKQTSSALGEDVSFLRSVSDSYTGFIAKGKTRCAENLRWLIARLKEGKAVNWHCAVGCDRCGTLSLLIEGLLGLSEEDLGRDYELSCFAGFKRYRSTKAFRGMVPYIRTYGPSDDLAQCFYNYWLSAGMTPEELDYLRSVMLE